MRGECKVALIGFGGVNRSLVELIIEHNSQRRTPKVTIVGVSDLVLGHCIDESGLNSELLLQVPAREGAFALLGGAAPDNEVVISHSGCDVVVEATYSNVATGEPGASLCEAALLAGKHVITTNKGSVAHGADRLTSVAALMGRKFLYEGAVMSGTPVLNWATDCFPGGRVTRVRGILNGTTNFILGQMEMGFSLTAALEQAQHLGYAEADPTTDIEGLDARAKIIVLARSVFGKSLFNSNVPCEGITSVTSEMIAQAKAEGRRWKLVGEIIAEEGELLAKVGPVKLRPDDPLSAVASVTNALELTIEPLGVTMMTGPGAGRVETAYAIFSDLLRLAGSLAREGGTTDAG